MHSYADSSTYATHKIAEAKRFRSVDCQHDSLSDYAVKNFEIVFEALNEHAAIINQQANLINQQADALQSYQVTIRCQADKIKFLQETLIDQLNSIDERHIDVLRNVIGEQHKKNEELAGRLKKIDAYLCLSNLD